MEFPTLVTLLVKVLNPKTRPQKLMPKMLLPQNQRKNNVFNKCIHNCKITVFSNTEKMQFWERFNGAAEQRPDTIQK